MSGGEYMVKKAFFPIATAQVILVKYFVVRSRLGDTITTKLSGCTSDWQATAYDVQHTPNTFSCQQQDGMQEPLWTRSAFCCCSIRSPAVLLALAALLGASPHTATEQIYFKAEGNHLLSITLPTKSFAFTCSMTLSSVHISTLLPGVCTLTSSY